MVQKAFKLNRDCSGKMAAAAAANADPDDMDVDDQNSQEDKVYLAVERVLGTIIPGIGPEFEKIRSSGNMTERQRLKLKAFGNLVGKLRDAGADVTVQKLHESMKALGVEAKNINTMMAWLYRLLYLNRNKSVSAEGITQTRTPRQGIVNVQAAAASTDPDDFFDVRYFKRFQVIVDEDVTLNMQRMVKLSIDEDDFEYGKRTVREFCYELDDADSAIFREYIKDGMCKIDERYPTLYGEPTSDTDFGNIYLNRAPQFPAKLKWYPSGSIKSIEYFVKGSRFRPIGPALATFYANGKAHRTEYYNYINGRLHRDFVDRGDQLPAVVVKNEDGVVTYLEYRFHGLIERQHDLPAIVHFYDNGQAKMETHYQGSQISREGDLPARIRYHPHGTISSEEFLVNGQYHREGNLPAHVVYGSNNTATYFAYYTNGVLGNADQTYPTIVSADDDGTIRDIQYWQNGEIVDVVISLTTPDGQTRNVEVPHRITFNSDGIIVDHIFAAYRPGADVLPVEDIVAVLQATNVIR